MMELTHLNKTAANACIYDSIHKFEENCLTVNDNTPIKLSFFTDFLMYIYMCVTFKSSLACLSLR